jgi:glycosyltransferase involved in cell wall biosynthesis
MSAKDILLFTDWYVPGYKAGGPVRSVANMVRALPHRFWIVTSVFDHQSSKPYPGIEPNRWIALSEREHVLYLRPEDINPARLDEILKERAYAFVHLNSLFSPRFTLMPLRRLRKLRFPRHRIILAPRGMLKSGALNVKARKKKIFLAAANLTGFFKGITWHATNEEEAREIRDRINPKARITIAPNLPEPAEVIASAPYKQSGRLHLVSLSRVSPEKNIAGGIHLLGPLSREGEIVWDIFGSHEAGPYMEECRAEAARFPSLKIKFKGVIPHAEISAALRPAHFMFLPTLGENFGHAISESLLRGVPVITSDRTPWRGLREENCGFDADLDNGEMTEALRTALMMDAGTYAEFRSGAAQKSRTLSEDRTALQANLRLFDPE